MLTERINLALLKMRLDALHNNVFDYSGIIGAGFLVIALVFVWRSFYKMRIPLRQEDKVKA